MKKNYSLIATLFMLLSFTTQGQTGSVTLKDGSGNTIASYSSIALAYNAIPPTITMSYIIEINTNYDGSMESYPITLSAHIGSGPANTITLRPEASVVSCSISSTQSSIALILLDDADYIIIDGRPGGIGTSSALTINNQGTATSSYGVNLINGACNNIIRHCNISGYTSSSSGGKGIYIGASSVNPSGNSDNLFEFLTFDNGPRYYMNSVGTSANPNRNLKVYGCSFKNINFCGWWQQAGTGKVTVDSCFFYGTGSGGTSGTGVFPILSDFQTDTIIVTRNSIYNIDNFANLTDVIGIALRSFNVGSVIRIYNNLINLSAPNPSVDEMFGIEFGTNNANSPFDAKVYNNTVVLSGTPTGGTIGNVGSAAFSISNSDAGSNVDVRNNLFINNRTGGSEQQLAVSRISDLGNNTIDYNNYRSAGADFARLGATVYPDLASYQIASAGTDMNSKNVAVTFASAMDLHLSPPSSSDVNLYGVALPEITVDYDGELRVHNFMGADEPDASTGIYAFNSTGSSVNIFPNPARNEFSVKSTNGNISKIEIYNVHGELTFSKDFYSVKEYMVNANSFAKGLYFIKVLTNAGVDNRKLILLN